MTAPSSSNTNNAASNTNNSNSGGNVRVVVRIRPLSKTEKEKNCQPVMVSLESNSNSSNSGSNRSLNSSMHSSNNNNGTAQPEVLQVLQPENRWYEYDAVLGDACSQKDVYRRSGARTVITQDLFQGYNGTVLAYGQTGAGKTFTMGTSFDSSDQAGILPRACQDVFDCIQQKCDNNAQVELQYLEIYNEEIRDLLCNNNNNNNSAKLRIRETLSGEVYVSGLTAVPVHSPQHIGELLDQASKRRMVGSTAMNAVSSRSHAICTLRITGVLEGGEHFCSKLTMVDLAGSERIKKTGAQGNRALEGIHINKSLSVLGQVVSSLSNPTSRRKPPYRDSKLTRLLQDSLGGNSRTIMLACVSPADYNLEESVNTLRYATSARNIKNSATQNIVKVISQEEALALQRENQLLKQQVAELQEALKKLSLPGEGPNPPPEVATDSEAEEEEEEEKKSADEDEETAAAEALEASDVFDPEELLDQVPEVATVDPVLQQSRVIRGLTKQLSEAQIGSQRVVRRLTKQLSEAKLDLRAAAGMSLIEVPALKLKIGQLEDKLKEKELVEKENDELRSHLEEAKADAAGARQAANKLSSIMEQLKSIKKDELHHKRLQYHHTVKERNWVDFVAQMLDNRSDQLEELQKDFDQVLKVVESSPVPQQQQQSTRWLHRAKYHDNSNSQREATLKRNVRAFKDRMDCIQSDILVRVMSLQRMKDKLRNRCKAMEQEIGNHVGQTRDIVTAQENGVLSELFDMLIRPTVKNVEEIKSSSSHSTTTPVSTPEYEEKELLNVVSMDESESSSDIVLPALMGERRDRLPPLPSPTENTEFHNFWKKSARWMG